MTLKLTLFDYLISPLFSMPTFWEDRNVHPTGPFAIGRVQSSIREPDSSHCTRVRVAIFQSTRARKLRVQCGQQQRPVLLEWNFHRLVALILGNLDVLTHCWCIKMCKVHSKPSKIWASAQPPYFAAR